MAPRRLKKAAAALSTVPTGTEQPDAGPHTMLGALDHLPPQALSTPALSVKPSTSDDDLTPPPPDLSASKEPVSEAAVQAFASTVAASGAATSDAEVKQETELAEPADAKPAAKRGRRKAALVAQDANAMAADEEGQQEVEDVKPKRGRTKKAVVEDDESVIGEEKVTPKKRGRKAATTAVEADEDGPGADEDGETPKKKKKPTPKKSRIAKDEPEYDEEGNEIPKKKRKVKEKPKVVYDILPVERKESTFRGRLGYACLNTVLRNTKPDSIFCSRTCRIASIVEEGLELPKGLALMNVRDLKTMIEWNEQNKIRFMRLSSEMFPFASHAQYGYDLSFADAGLKECGELARKYGHRLTMHPGQFTQLGSPKENVVEASIRELNYQCEILDRMGMGKDSVMIIHMGGVYGDKPSTLERFKLNFKRLQPNVAARVVLENDELCYNVDDLWPVCDELSIPIIFDYHHDWIHPSSEPPSVLIPRIATLWERRGIKMKQHLSEPRPGAETIMERRAHADRCQNLPPDLPDDCDLMIEAKDKEQAVFELYRIYALEDVIHDNLRPANPHPSKQTNGRKSSKRKTKKMGEDSEGESVVLSDVEKEGDGGIGDEAEESQNIQAVHKTPKRRVTKGKVKVEEDQESGETQAKAAQGGELRQSQETASASDEQVVTPAPTRAPAKRGRPKKVVAPTDAETQGLKEDQES